MLGPVSSAANGGDSGPGFNFFIGFGLLAITWFGFWSKQDRTKPMLLIALGITIVCLITIGFGIHAALNS